MTLRIALRSEFEERKRRNRRFSLRAFARRLGTDHATLSQWMRGRRRLTPAVARRIARRLELSEEMRATLVLETSILRMVRRGRFERDARVIARFLNVSSDAVNVALQRLLRTRELVMKDGSWEAIDVEPGRAVADRH